MGIKGGNFGANTKNERGEWQGFTWKSEKHGDLAQVTLEGVLGGGVLGEKGVGL